MNAMLKLKSLNDQEDARLEALIKKHSKEEIIAIIEIVTMACRSTNTGLAIMAVLAQAKLSELLERTSVLEPT